MSRTVPRQRPRSFPRGSYTAVCGHCGGEFPSHKMRQERTGTWACADGQGCFTAGDMVTLSEIIARDGAAPPRPRRPLGPPPRRQENGLATSPPFDPSRVLP